MCIVYSKLFSVFRFHSIVVVALYSTAYSCLIQCLFNSTWILNKFYKYSFKCGPKTSMHRMRFNINWGNCAVDWIPTSLSIEMMVMLSILCAPTYRCRYRDGIAAAAASWFGKEKLHCSLRQHIFFFLVFCCLVLCFVVSMLFTVAPFFLRMNLFWQLRSADESHIFFIMLPIIQIRIFPLLSIKMDLWWFQSYVWGITCEFR